MSLGPKEPVEAEVFEPVAGVELQRLPLVPREAFVLSRIDGPMALGQIAVVTGLDEASVATILARLQSLGAVSRRGPQKNTPASTEGPSREEPVDLEPERRARIETTFQNLDALTFYELLGVSEDADTKVIRAAYFEQSKEFHPDSAFRKKIGPFRSKMESIFQRLTAAYETLTKPKLRQEYEAQLVAKGRKTVRPPQTQPPQKPSSVAPGPHIPDFSADDPPTGMRKQSPEERRQIAEELLKRRLKPKPKV